MALGVRGKFGASGGYMAKAGVLPELVGGAALDAGAMSGRVADGTGGGSADGSPELIASGVTAAAQAGRHKRGKGHAHAHAHAHAQMSGQAGANGGNGPTSAPLSVASTAACRKPRARGGF